MCLISVSSGQAAFRRSASLLDLGEGSTDRLDGAVGLKPSQSLGDLLKARAQALGDLPGHERSDSGQSSSSETGRSSPTSGYEQVLRSRSPCAVLYATEEPAPPAAALYAPQPAAPAPAVLQQASQQALQQQQQSSRQQAALLPPLPPGRSLARASPLVDGHGGLAAAADAAADSPFLGLESAADFKEIEVQAAAASGRASTLGSAFGLPSSSLGGRSDSSTSTQALAAAVAAAAAEDPICAAAASQSLFASGGAGTGGAWSSPSTASGGCGALAAEAAAPSPSPFARLSLQQHPSVIAPLQPTSLLHQAVPLPPGIPSSGSSASSPTGPAAHSRAGSISELSRRGSLDGWGTSSHLSEGHAAEELFYRLNHARQTVEFVKRQATAFSQLNKTVMGVWEALELLNTLREYETALLGGAEGSAYVTPDMPLLEYALQCAEACRAAFPDEDFMHLASLLAPLGKLLAHAKFGAEPQWAICGETYPVGCRFHPSVRHSQYFSANPDRRKRLYSSPTGVYREGCGLGGVLMSWGAGEYLHMVLRLNRVPLPPEALFCIRHQKLQCVFRSGGPYQELLSEFDRVQLPRLSKFQSCCEYRRTPRAAPLLVPTASGELTAEGEPQMQVAPEVKGYYDRLLAKYIPQGMLRW